MYRIVIALLLMFSYSRPTFPQTDEEQERITKSATEICSQHQDWTEAQCAKAAQLDERQRSLQELIAGLCAEHKDWTRDHCASVAGGDEEKRKIRAKVAEFDEQVAVVCAQHPGWTRAQCAEAAESGDIENVDGPLRYVLSHADETGEGFVAFDCSRCSAMKDLLFVAATPECGNAGCDFYVFKKTKEASYGYVTNVFLNHGGFQFLKTVHHGMNDILFYHHMSAFEGVLGRYEFDGKDYQLVGEGETIASGDFFSRIVPETVNQIYFSKDMKRIRR